MGALARFESAFSRDPIPKSCPGGRVVPRHVASILEGYGGVSFRGGLYRIATEAGALALDATVARMWPVYAGRVKSYAFDWRGRIFAVRIEADDKGGEVVLFEPGSGDVYDIPANLATFHNGELVDYPDETLSANLFQEWSGSRGSGPVYSKCVGYKVPLFLGGKEILANLEESELDVYLEISAQLWTRTKDLPVGTEISSVVIRR